MDFTSLFFQVGFHVDSVGKYEQLYYNTERIGAIEIRPIPCRCLTDSMVNVAQDSPPFMNQEDVSLDFCPSRNTWPL